MKRLQYKYHTMYRLTKPFKERTMLDSVIIPLVKNKCGDLSDISNYRPIAISCIVSKIFENVILLTIEEYL